MKFRKVIFGFVGAVAVTAMSGCASMLDKMASGNAYMPAKVTQISLKHMQMLNQFALAAGSLECYPEGKKTYVWQRVPGDVYDAARLGPLGGYSQMGNIASGAEGRLKAAQYDAEETNALPYQKHAAVPDELYLHVDIGEVKYNEAAVGMNCAQTKAMGASANIGVSSHPLEAWVNRGHLDTVLVRQLDPTGKKYSTTEKWTWDQVQAFINKATDKGKMENF